MKVVNGKIVFTEREKELARQLDEEMVCEGIACDECPLCSIHGCDFFTVMNFIKNN